MEDVSNVRAIPHQRPHESLSQRVRYALSRNVWRWPPTCGHFYWPTIVGNYVGLTLSPNNRRPGGRKNTSDFCAAPAFGPRRGFKFGCLHSGLDLLQSPPLVLEALTQHFTPRFYCTFALSSILLTLTIPFHTRSP
jgi:hypothetical protein